MQAKANHEGQNKIRCATLTSSLFENYDLSAESRSRKLDAIFIPTSRKSERLSANLPQLTREAKHVFLIPSSPIKDHWASHPLRDGKVSMVDTTDTIETLQERFLEIPSSINPTTDVSRSYDLPLKRNIALAMAELLELERICLLDDDITVPPGMLSVAAGQLSSTNPVGGFYCYDFPDVSTIEHIQRICYGIESRTMPGGNCLVLYRPAIKGFFPYVYNEDWLFLHNTLEPPTTSGLAFGAAMQEPYQPWEQNGRAAFEEFGETIITGVLELGGLESRRKLYEEGFWEDILQLRHADLKQLQEECDSQWAMMSVREAIATHKEISAADCLDFISKFNQDREQETWQNTLSKLQFKLKPLTG